MSAVVMIEPPLVPLPGLEPEGPTLEQVIAAAWADLGRHRAVQCPVCGSHQMEPEYGAHALPHGGRCRGCGSELR
jgi:hypothetical protein